VTGSIARLRIYRFEVAAAGLLALVLVSWAVWLTLRLSAIGAPARCVADWLILGPTGRPDCTGVMHAWAQVMGSDTEPFFAAVRLLPFAAGLIVGVPIVAGELESQTAQVTWWLHASRASWLGRTIAVTVLPMALAFGIAAIATDTVAVNDELWGVPAFERVGLRGVLLPLHAMAAAGLGLLVGAVIGRALPAFLVAAALSAVLIVGTSLARDEWTRLQPAAVIGTISPETGEFVVDPRSITTGWGWQAPSGEVALSETPGYAPVVLGISDAVARQWEGWEIMGYVGLSAIAGLSTAAVVVRRRPL